MQKKINFLIGTLILIPLLVQCHLRMGVVDQNIEEADPTPIPSISEPVITPSITISPSISIIPTTGNTSAASDGYYRALSTATAPVLDGKGDDSCWDNAAEGTISYLWMGQTVTDADFSGTFKIVWDTQKIYLLITITDDITQNQLNELSDYWMGDCVEIFIDEDKSGGDHHYNHQAFAYHISQATQNDYDIGTDMSVHIYNHSHTVISQSSTTTTWEIALDVYDDTFTDGGSQTPVTLNENKTLGFTLAYCDNDNTGTRQSFIGSKSSHGVGNDEGYIKSDVFGTLELVK